MEELTKEQLARMYGAYMGCECIVLVTAGEEKSWWQKAFLTGIYQYQMAEVQHQYENYAEEEPNHYEFSHCKLRLTPQSEIEDEDAIEVHRIENSRINGVAIIGMRILKRMGFISHFKDGSPIHLCPDAVKNVVAIIDYLRSPFRPDGTPKPVYDCGFAHIKSLIEAGYADKKQA